MQHKERAMKESAIGGPGYTVDALQARLYESPVYLRGGRESGELFDRWFAVLFGVTAEELFCE